MKLDRQGYIIIALTVALVGVSVYAWLRLEEAAAEAKASFEAQGAVIEQKDQELAVKEDVIAELSERLALTSEELNDTTDRLRGERERNDAFEKQITQIAGTVSDLDKLSKTDKELLQKYSKVYFLNEHYIPESLSEIDKDWKYSETRSHKLHSKVIPFFNSMLEDAKEDGVEIWVTSAYRSFTEQAQLKGHYTVVYGSGANTFSADQGFSEHQLGTTVDFTTRGLNGGLEGFQNTPAYKWLQENAHHYGFTLSYPEGNAYYVFEPWHWRFVGVNLAADLKRDNAHFYDWDQRKIDGYLLHIFD